MPIYSGNQKIKDITFNNQTIKQGYYGNTLVFESNTLPNLDDNDETTEDQTSSTDTTVPTN